MTFTIELGYYLLCVAVSATAFSCIGFWYVLPRLRARPLADALTPLLLFSAFRVAGLFFLVGGIAGPDLPAGFAVPTAYGDASAAILALAGAFALRRNARLGIAIAWIYNVVGSLDLLHAVAQVVIQGVTPGQLGATWILPAFNVPALFVVHALMFVLLVRRPAPASR